MMSDMVVTSTRADGNTDNFRVTQDGVCHHVIVLPANGAVVGPPEKLPGTWYAPILSGQTLGGEISYFIGYAAGPTGLEVWETMRTGTGPWSAPSKAV